MSSTILVFDSQSDFISNSIRFQFTDCCSQSRPNRHRYQIFLFGGDAAGLSIATSYGAFKSYSPTRNLITTFESSCDGNCWDYASEQDLNQVVVLADFSSLWNPYENRQLRLMQPPR
jgi:hypothetical protein